MFKVSRIQYVNILTIYLFNQFFSFFFKDRHLTKKLVVHLIQYLSHEQVIRFSSSYKILINSILSFSLRSISKAFFNAIVIIIKCCLFNQSDNNVSTWRIYSSSSKTKNFLKFLMSYLFLPVFRLASIRWRSFIIKSSSYTRPCSSTWIPCFG